MLKKILTGVGILAVIVLALFGYTTYKVFDGVNQKLEAKEPEFRQYLTMTGGEQNAYIEKNMNELWECLKFDNARADVREDAETVTAAMQDEKLNQKFIENVQNDVGARDAGIALGRSIVSVLILSSDSMVADLTEEQKRFLKKDADLLDARLDRYAMILEKLDPNNEK